MSPSKSFVVTVKRSSAGFWGLGFLAASAHSLTEKGKARGLKWVKEREKQQKRWITSVSSRSGESPFKQKEKHGPIALLKSDKILFTHNLTLSSFVSQATLIPMHIPTPASCRYCFILTSRYDAYFTPVLLLLSLHGH